MWAPTNQVQRERSFIQGSLPVCIVFFAQREMLFASLHINPDEYRSLKQSNSN
jgi:hypothetical protein